MIVPGTILFPTFVLPWDTGIGDYGQRLISKVDAPVPQLSSLPPGSTAGLDICIRAAVASRLTASTMTNSFRQSKPAAS